MKKNDKALFIFVANQLRNTPIFADIEYTNLKDGNIHPLFHSSKPVQTSTGEKKAPLLPRLSTYPDTMHHDTSYVRQTMPPFGAVNSLYQYTYNADYFQFHANNTTNISYARFKAVKINNMFTSGSIIMTKQGILIYGIGSVKLTGIAGMLKGTIENSFTSRMVRAVSLAQQYYGDAQQLIFGRVRASRSQFVITRTSCTSCNVLVSSSFPLLSLTRGTVSGGGTTVN